MVEDGTIWIPTSEDIIEEHHIIMQETGGPDDVLNEGLIHAAVERARWGPFTCGGELVERAAFLLRGIAQDHPFLDGNKRTAITMTDTMLFKNGYKIEAVPSEATPFMVKVATGEHGLEEIRSWILHHLRKI